MNPPTHEVNPNEIIATFLTQNLQRYESRIAGFLKSGVRNIAAMVKGKYSAYLSKSAEKHLKIRTFFHRDSPIRLYNVYVPLELRQKTSGKDDKFDANMTRLSAFPFVTVVGTGGVGKSTMMRHLFLDTLQRTSKVPVFVELRDFDGKSIDFESEILKHLYDSGLDYEHRYLQSCLKSGDFALFLDGFDEVDPRLQGNLAVQIRVFQSRYPRNLMIVSSRPDHKLTEWKDAVTFEVQPLTLSKAVDLVARLPYDPAIVKSFNNALIDGLFSEHTSFLSNPLLLTIMLLTYGEHASIPTQLTEFYNHAFEALFQKHDANKGVFVRHRKSNLSMHEFRRLFSAFSLLTYSDQKYQFDLSYAVEKTDVSKKLTEIQVDSSDFIGDAIQSVCLLVEDGQIITYTHRSLQEYFSAIFVDRYLSIERARRVIEKLRSRANTDSFFSMLREINPRLVDLEFAVPYVTELAKAVGFEGDFTKPVYLKFIKSLSSSITLGEKAGDTSVLSFSISSDEIWHDYWSNFFFICREYTSFYESGRVFDENMSTIETESITIESPEFDLLWKINSGVFSWKALDGILALKDKLLLKWEKLDQNLDDILLSSE